MRDATMERLSRLISDDSKENPNRPPRRPLLDLKLSFPEGWLLPLLLAAVLYSTVWCVQAAAWVEHLGVLSFTTAVGLGLGIVAAKQERFPAILFDLVSCFFGIILSFWQVTGAFYSGNFQSAFEGMQQWFSLTTSGAASTDDAIFLLMIIVLGFFLAYLSAWLLYRSRTPWLMIAANATVLLINLNNTNASFIFFLVLFLISSLLLLLRFNLYESIQAWQQKGLRYSTELSWDVMQAGSLISVVILVLSWILPGSYRDPFVGQIWEMDESPFVMVQNTWNRAFSVNGGNNSAPNRGNFTDTLGLGGNPNLTQEIVFKVKTSDNKQQYLLTVAYDTYAPRAGWSIEHEDDQMTRLNPNLSYASGGVMTYNVKQQIEVVAPPGGNRPYLAGASQITSISLPAKVLNGPGGTIAWLGDNTRLTEGLKYTVNSAVSGADEKTLRSVPMPADAPKFNPAIADITPSVLSYDENAVANFTQIPASMEKPIKALAEKIVKDAKAETMYDKVVALETYLRTNYKYNLNVQPKSGVDPVLWFLFENPNKDGYCNYFASSLSLLARSLDIPTRVVAGYNSGTFDKDRYVIRGANAHSWTQVYFAGYGWINFEPSASFRTFDRPLPNQYPGTGTENGETTNGGSSTEQTPGKLKPEEEEDDGSVGGSANTNSGPSIQQGISITLGSVILLLIFALIWFGIWWRSLFKRHSLAAQLYGRMCVLASWAGIQLRASQTPYEYVQELSITALPSTEDTHALERLGDIYVRERWADPKSPDHPQQKGEISELPALWRRLQPLLFFYVLRHPRFLSRVPAKMREQIAHFRRKRKERKLLQQDI